MGGGGARGGGGGGAPGPSVPVGDVTVVRPARVTAGGTSVATALSTGGARVGDCRPDSRAAPSATACLGWTSMATGRPSADISICPTSGMRDEPPTSSTDRSSSG